MLRIGPRRAAVMALVIAIATNPRADAGDGTWITDADDDWSDSSNWMNSDVADGADFTATFDNAATTFRSVTLDVSRTIGNVTLTGNKYWGLLPNGASVLTLARTSGTPTITASGNAQAYIGTPLAGSQGVSVVIS